MERTGGLEGGHDALGDGVDLFLGRHRCPAVVAVLAVGYAISCGLLWLRSGSLPGSALVALMLGAAALVVLLPAAVCVVCVAERLEERWRAGIDPAVADRRRRRETAALESRRRLERVVEHPERQPLWWCGLGLEALRSRIGEVLVGDGWALESPPGRDASGVDLVAVRAGSRRVVRCEPGGEAVPAAVARELVAARLDLEADDAVLAAPAGVEPGTLGYLAKRSILLWDGAELARRATGAA